MTPALTCPAFHSCTEAAELADHGGAGAPLLLEKWHTRQPSCCCYCWTAHCLPPPLPCCRLPAVDSHCWTQTPAWAPRAQRSPSARPGTSSNRHVKGSAGVPTAAISNGRCCCMGCISSVSCHNATGTYRHFPATMCDNCHGALISTPGPLCHPRACLAASFLHTAPPCSPHVPMPPHSHTYTCPPPPSNTPTPC